MARYGCWILAIAFCLILGACNYPAGSAVRNPSADSFHTLSYELRTGQTKEKVEGASVTRTFFQDAKIHPLLGRLFIDQDFQSQGASVVLVSDSLWQRRFGGDPALIGKTLLLDERPYTIVGVLPKTFQFPGTAELWTPQK